MIIKTASGPLYFEITGEGPPLVFASGWAMSSQCWRPVVALLEDRFRCMIYDARGTGRSQPASASAGFEIEDHAEDLHQLIGMANFYDATIIGHEVGAIIAAVCAEHHPQDSTALVMVSPRAGIAEEEIRKLSLYTPAALALRELATYPLIRNLIAWRFRSAPSEYREQLFEDFADLDPRAAYQTAVSAANLDSSLQLESLIEQITSPVLLVCGEKDKKSVARARHLFSKVRAGKIATLKNCGFLPMLEYQRQFARVIADFATGAQKSSRKSLRRIITD
jgi:proline iminopeptidase